MYKKFNFQAGEILSTKELRNSKKYNLTLEVITKVVLMENPLKKGNHSTIADSEFIVKHNDEVKATSKRLEYIEQFFYNKLKEFKTLEK